MFRLLYSLPQVSPYGSCTISLRSLLGDTILIQGWLAADLSLLKEAIQPIFCVPVEQILLFGPSLEPLSDQTWIRRIPITNGTRVIYTIVDITIQVPQKRSTYIIQR